MNTKTALLIIDVQLGMFLYEKFPLYRENELLDNIYALAEKARKANIPVVYIQHTSDDNEILGRGKPGWIIHPMIMPAEGDIIVEKTTPDSFYDTKLNEILRSMKINNLIICGLQTEYCVDTTCRRAFSLGYETILVEDAHSTYDNGILSAAQIITHHNNVLGGCFARVMATEKVFEDVMSNTNNVARNADNVIEKIEYINKSTEEFYKK